MHNLVDGHLSCTKAYSIPESVQNRHETVVFGGILYGHFGHVITDTLCRLWWYTDHPDTSYKLVFLEAPVQGGFKYYDVLDAIGIKKEQMEIITEPTRFDKIIVPQETLNMVSSYRPGVEKIYDYIRSRVVPAGYKKVYLSRTAITDGGIFVNEEYFENFYRCRGYEIVHPEKLPFEEQVSILSGAEEVVVTYGTLVHLVTFCRPSTHIIILNRCDDVFFHLFPLLQSRKSEYYLIDAFFGFLPTTQPPVYFVGPTIYWRKYLDKQKISYKEEDVSIENNVRPFVYDYILKWLDYATSMDGYKAIRNKSLVDIIEIGNRIFFARQIDRKALPDRDDIIKIKKENTELKNKVNILEDILQTALAKQSQAQFTALEQTLFNKALNVLLNEKQ